MRKVICILLFVCIVSSATWASAKSYTVTTQGMMGEISVTTEIADGKIVSISVGEHKETVGIGEMAIEKIPQLIVDTQSLAVEAVSGATVTSKAILSAVEESCKQAGLDLDKLKSNTLASTKPTATDTETEIVVVGGGGAGMTAAIRASELGKKVILLEKMDVLGGNTVMSTTGYFAVNSRTQKEQGSTETVQSFYEWLMSSNVEEFPMDPAATMVVAEKSGESIDWMMDLGADFGRVFNRFFHSPTDGSAPGGKMVMALKNKMDAMGIDYRLNNKAVSLILDENHKLAGVNVDSPDGSYKISAKVVILAAGGFAANPDMLAQYSPVWATLGCSSSKGQNGDGIRMAIDIGADVVHMDNIKVNPTVFYHGDSRLSMSTLRSNGGLLVNKMGKRFFNETGNYTQTSLKLLEQPDQLAYMVFDATMLKIGLMEQYKNAGFFIEANTVEELAEKAEIDPQGLANEIQRNKMFAEKGVDEDFGRSNLSIKFDTPPFYAVKVYPAAQGTFGGLKVTVNAEVISTEGDVIPGLYAAGENAGEGTEGNCPLVENTVFGMLAAEGAAALLDNLH